MEKSKWGIILLIIGIVLILLSIPVYSYLTSYVAEMKVTLSGLAGFMLSSPVVWVGIILIGVGLYLKIKKK